MRSWFQRFMSGRYGFDPFGRFLVIVSLILVLIGSWLSPILYILGIITLIWCYYRMFSRNHAKRYAENAKYMQYSGKVRAWFGKRQMRFRQRKQYRYFHCPKCHQELRVPRGRGKISITCPKCGTQFIKKS